MAVVYKVPIQSGSDNTAPLPHNIISQLVTTNVGMVMWEWCCVITAILYVYFVDHCHAQHLSMNSFYIIL